MDNISIKENICRIRKQLGLTQEETAHRLGISLTAYRDLEKGSTSIINSNIYKMAEITGTSTEELVLGYSPTPNINNVKEMQIEYGNRINSLQARISDLEKIISLQEDTIESKNEIISMLKKNID